MAHETPPAENRPFSPLLVRAVGQGFMDVRKHRGVFVKRGFSVVDIDMDEEDHGNDERGVVS